MDRFYGQIVYFSIYFSGNSGITRYSGHFAADGQIHYYESRLYNKRCGLKKINNVGNTTVWYVTIECLTERLNFERDMSYWRATVNVV